MPLWNLCAQAQPGPAGPGGFPTEFIFMILIIFVGYYFLIILPQKKDRAERQKMLDGLKKGDRVVTTAGIHGKVADITKRGDSEIVTLECAPKIQLEFSRSAIAVVVRRKEGAEGAGEAADDEAPKAGKGKRG